jgi:hypothetical protein
LKVPSLGVPDHPELIVEIAGYSRQRLSQEASRIFYQVEKQSIRGGVVIELV